MISNRIGGVISVLLGGLAIQEAVRLYALRMGPYGDHTLPGLVGVFLVLLGILVFYSKEKDFKVEFPSRKIGLKMLWTVVILFAYRFMLPILGYVISSFIAAFGLFKIMGAYNLLKSFSFSVALTVVLYLLFIYWLMMPFPTGIFNI